MNKTTLKFFQLSVAFSGFSKHRLNLLSESFDSSWAADASRFVLDCVNLSLKLQDLFLVHYKLLAKVFSELSVLVGNFSVGDF